MVSCSTDSEFPDFDDHVLPKIEKLDLCDDDFDKFPWRAQHLESLNFLSHSINVLAGANPKSFGSCLPTLKHLSMTRIYFEGAVHNIFSLELKSLEIWIYLSKWLIMIATRVPALLGYFHVLNCCLIFNAFIQVPTFSLEKLKKFFVLSRH